MDARIETVEEMRVAFVRHVGPYQDVGPTWQELCGWAGMKGLFGPQTKMFGACYDDPEITPAEKIRYDACIAVADEVQPEGKVGVQTIAGGRYAVTTLEGSYDGLAECYATLIGQWMPAQGVEPAAELPCLEFYENDPNQVPEEELRTDVYVPLKA